MLHALHVILCFALTGNQPDSGPASGQEDFSAVRMSGSVLIHNSLQQLPSTRVVMSATCPYGSCKHSVLCEHLKHLQAARTVVQDT